MSNGPLVLDTTTAVVPELTGDCPFDVYGDVASGDVVAGPIVQRGEHGYLMKTTRAGDDNGPRVANENHLLYVPWDHDVSHWDVMTSPEYMAETMWLLTFYFGCPRDEWPAIAISWVSGMQFGRTQRHAHLHIRVAVVGGTTITYPNPVNPE